TADASHTGVTTIASPGAGLAPLGLVASTAATTPATPSTPETIQVVFLFIVLPSSAGGAGAARSAASPPPEQWTRPRAGPPAATSPQRCAVAPRPGRGRCRPPRRAPRQRSARPATAGRRWRRAG